MSKIYPNRGLAQKLIDECRARGVLRNQCAYILATSQWETNHTHMPVEEAYYIQSAAARENYLKSKPYYPYYGRGLVQLTWDYNYERADKKLGLEGRLERDLGLAMDPDIAVEIIIVGMMEGWFTTRPLTRYVTLQESDFYNARRVVNGTDHAAEIAGIAEAYDKSLLEQGYGVEEPEAPPEPPASLEDRIVEALKTIDLLEARISALELWRKS